MSSHSINPARPLAVTIYGEKGVHERHKNEPTYNGSSYRGSLDTDIEDAPGERDFGEGKDKSTAPPNIIQRVLTARTARSYPDPGPAPDGGLQAWLQVVQGHLCLFNAMGYASSYGFFLAHYLKPDSGFEPGLGRNVWAWPGSLQMFFFCFLGSLSGRLFDAGFYRHVLCFGFSLQIIGIFTTAICTSFWQILLVQGAVQGIGNGFILAPTMSCMSTYFVKKRALAISTVATGSATGGVVFPLIAQQLLPKVGFPWTVRVMGFVMLGNMAIILTLARTRIPPRRSGPWIERQAFREPVYVLFVIGMFFVYLGLYFAFNFINYYAKTIIGVSESTSLSILLILSAVGVPGRIFPALIADHYLGQVNTLLPSIFLLGVMFFVWIAISSVNALYAFAAIYGLFNAAVQGISMGGMSSLTKDLNKTGTRLGMALSILSFAALGGPPIAGALVDVSGGSFLYTQIFGGLVSMIGCGFLCVVRIKQVGCRVEKI